MIQGFELETAPLSDYEKDVLLPIMVRCLANKVGRRSAVTNRYIVDRLTAQGYAIQETRVRKIISHIRAKGLVPCLIATSKGYYVSKDIDEIKSYVDSLKGREMAIRAIREAVESQAGLY